ncbi:MAG: YfiR family protein [Helicobacteraceae bacterium]|jgi:hypothetical protein|nr:YfiR family protein [Helicobacteraceae bacterium]
MMKKTALFFFFIVTLFFPASLMAEYASMTDIKAAYIFNFIRYTSWPEVDEKEAVFHLCVHKNSDIRQSLKLLENKIVKNQSITIVSVENPGEELSLCEVLVLPELKEEELKTFISAAKSSKILTVSDSEGYAGLGVMINLVVRDNKVKFEVNLDEIEDSELKISSNLLKLATIIQSNKR